MIYTGTHTISASIPRRTAVTGQDYTFRLKNTISHFVREFEVTPVVDAMYFHLDVEIPDKVYIEEGEYDYALLCDGVPVGEGIICLKNDEEVKEYGMNKNYIQYGGNSED